MKQQQTYYSSCILSKNNVSNIITGFYNDLQMQQNNLKSIIKKTGTEYSEIKNAVNKNLGLFFRYSSLDFYCFPLLPHDTENYLILPRGSSNIDMASPYETPYSLRCIVWPYLSLDDFGYYLMVKSVHDGCPVCKSKKFWTYKDDEKVEPVIRIDKSNITDIEPVDNKWIESYFDRMNGSEFRCSDCGDVIGWSEILKAYSLGWFAG